MVTSIKQGLSNRTENIKSNIRANDERKEQSRRGCEKWTKLCSLQSHQFSRKIANSHAGYSVVRVPGRLNPKPSLPSGVGENIRLLYQTSNNFWHNIAFIDTRPFRTNSGWQWPAVTLELHFAYLRRGFRDDENLMAILCYPCMHRYVPRVQCHQISYPTSP
jgi:hypothetical protein